MEGHTMKTWTLGVIGGATAYALLNLGWLWAANSAEVSEPQRNLLKGGFVGAAVVLYLLIAALLAIRSDKHQWIARTAGISGSAVAAGFALIVALSLVIYRGQFFHDQTFAEALPRLCVAALLLGFGSGLLAPVVGLLARLTSQSLIPR